MRAASRDAFAERAADFAWCEAVIERNSRSFHRAFSLLPERKRQSVYALYAFCRAADDCADRLGSAEALCALRSQLDRFCAGEVPDGPLWRAMEAVFFSFDVDERPFYDMLEGQRRDLAFRQPATMDELEEYGFYVAGSVGLMLLPILRASSSASASLRESGIALGVAMQLTNVLRDVGEDAARGRVYLPTRVLEEAGCSERDLHARTPSAAFRRAWEAVARRSEELYRPMERDVRELDEDSRLPALSSLLLYRAIMDEVRASGYACLTRRCSVPERSARRLVAAAARTLSEGR